MRLCLNLEAQRLSKSLWVSFRETAELNLYDVLHIPLWSDIEVSLWANLSDTLEGSFLSSLRLNLQNHFVIEMTHEFEESMQ